MPEQTSSTVSSSEGYISLTALIFNNKTWEEICKEIPQAPRIIAILQDTFEALEDGTASEVLVPDFFYRVFSKERVDSLIKAIDQDFEYELKSNKGFWSNFLRKEGELPQEIKPPDFNRLEGGSRLAFAQKLRRVFDD